LRYVSLVISVFLAGVTAAQASGDAPQASLYGQWITVLPPIAAIAFALLTHRVVPALFLGTWLGAWLLQGITLSGLWTGLLDAFAVHVRDALGDRDRASVILFSAMIAGMVGIISRNGGMQGIVRAVVRWASDARRTSLATAGMGLAIFFDDYANTLVVGNTMRPITDAMNVSREKLAYLVDSTAAPVACIALVTTWVGYEVGLIGDALAGLPGLDLQPYLVYLQSIPYSFYPLLALLFVFLVAGSGRDFGPMLTAERRARLEGVHANASLEQDPQGDAAAILPVPGQPQRAINALLPVAVLLASVLAGLYVSGRTALAAVEPGVEHGLRDIIGAADSYQALLWASLLGVLTAAGLSRAQGILNLEQIVDGWYRGVRSMLQALIILVLAWSLSGITEALGTAAFLVSTLGDTLPAWTLPALVFVLAAATGFGTGSSWGAMAILIPLVIPLTWAVLQAQGVADAEHMHLLYSAIASVLAGSVWGDHCSPISDTTILSSLASGCDHVQHVRTQLPYAGLVGLVSLACGSVLVALGLPWWGGLLLGGTILVLVLWAIGRPNEPG
jgi:Na+/H+ antiporter NhaC